jgi:hypothetical protein
MAMAVSNIETAYLMANGDFTGTVEMSFGASQACMQCTLSAVYDTDNNVGYFTGIVQYQTSNFFGGPTTHSFWSEAPYYIPNSIVDYNVIDVTFYISTFHDDFGICASMGSIFFLD